MPLTTTMPVMAQTITVSQKVPVMDTSACRTGLRVWAVAAAMGAVPRPLSLENRPRAMPYRQAIISAPPAKPPAAACQPKALLIMVAAAGRM